jgi:hypothetical protein
MADPEIVLEEIDEPPAPDLLAYAVENLEAAEDRLIAAAGEVDDWRRLTAAVRLAAPDGVALSPDAFILGAPNEIERATRRALIIRLVGKEPS